VREVLTQVLLLSTKPSFLRAFEAIKKALKRGFKLG
jgi:hypothetical protein